MSETNIADFLSNTISNFEIDESLWDSNISNHFTSRDKDQFGREKLDGETIIDYLQEQSKELKIKVVLIGTEHFSWTIFRRPDLFEIFWIPAKLPKFLLNGKMKERPKKYRTFEFCDLHFQSFSSLPIQKFPVRQQNRFRHVLNIPWIILQRETQNLPEYCLVPISKLKDMPREQYFMLLHFFNELQIIKNEDISSNEALPKFVKMTVPMQEDILANDYLKNGEKRKMPLEDGHEDGPVSQPSKKMKLENDFNEEPVISDNVIDDSTDFHCPVCWKGINNEVSEVIPKAGFQMRFEIRNSNRYRLY